MLRGGKLSLFTCPGVGNMPPRKEKIANPQGYAGGVTGQIEPCIIALLSFNSYLIIQSTLKIFHKFEAGIKLALTACWQVLMAASATESIRRSKFYLTEIASSSPSSLSSTLILLASMFERAASVSVTKQSLNNNFFFQSCKLTLQSSILISLSIQFMQVIMILSTKTIDLHKVSGIFPFDHDNGGQSFW